jgi:hypothetical protein
MITPRVQMVEVDSRRSSDDAVEVVREGLRFFESFATTSAAANVV